MKNNILFINKTVQIIKPKVDVIKYKKNNNYFDKIIGYNNIKRN